MPASPRSAFARFDKDLDGRLNRQEVLGMLGAMGVDAAKREAMADGVLSTLDSQGVGSIGIDDFSRIWDDSAAAKASPVPESPTPTAALNAEASMLAATPTTACPPVGIDATRAASTRAPPAL